jgi:RIO-like serine/threonine protein kinase
VAVAVVLIWGQMTHLVYEQMRVLFERDLRNIRALLQGKATWLRAVARDLAKIEQFAHEVPQGVEQVRAVWP